MTGSSIFDYVHHADHAEIAEQLGLSLTSQSGIASPSSATSDGDIGSHGTNNPDVATQMTLGANSTYKGMDRAFCIRMKSTLTKRGCHFKSSGYRASDDQSNDKQTVLGEKHGKTTASHYVVVLILCRLRPQYTFSHAKKSQPPLLGMVGLAIAMPPPSVHEIRLECDMFVTRINFDFKIAHAEPKVQELLDYAPEEIVGRNLYTLCHGADAQKLRKCHMDLINKGQVLTHYYRMMNKNGGYTWVQTCATIVCSAKNAEEQNIICVNYVISGKESPNLIMDTCQYEPVKVEEAESVLAKERASPKDGTSSTAEGKDFLGGNAHASPRAKSPEARRAAEPEDPPPASTRGRKRKLKPVATSTAVAAAAEKEIEEEPAKVASIPVESSTVAPPIDGKPENSVKELENAMSKHLPSATPTDFSTDALLKQQQQQQQQQADKSGAIQWIGHNAHFHQQAPMPATALLRQLYANRESVIRATTRPSAGFYSDSAPLPTPPGSEGSYENQFSLHHGAPGAGASSYPPYSAAMDYQNAMTPPSSVSPRETSASVGKTTGFEYVTDSLRAQYVGDGHEVPALPLKPQPYSAAAAAIHHANGLEAYDQSQYFGAGFHLYHKSQGWYPTPSS